MEDGRERLCGLSMHGEVVYNSNVSCGRIWENRSSDWVLWISVPLGNGGISPAVHALSTTFEFAWYLRRDGDSAVWQWGMGTLKKKKADIRGHKTWAYERHIYVCTQIWIHETFWSSLTCPPRPRDPAEYGYVQKAACSSLPVTIDIITLTISHDLI